MQVNSQHNYSTFICPFESRKCGKTGKKLEKFEYLENKNSFLDEKKVFFKVFEGLSFAEKIANTNFNVCSTLPNPKKYKVK